MSDQASKASKFVPGIRVEELYDGVRHGTLHLVLDEVFGEHYDVVGWDARTPWSPVEPMIEIRRKGSNDPLIRFLL